MSNEHVITLAKILDDKYPAAREALTEAREKLEIKLADAKRFIEARKQQPPSKRNSMNAASVAAADRKDKAVKRGIDKNNGIKTKINQVLDDLDAISKMVRPGAEPLLDDINQLKIQRDQLDDSVVKICDVLDKNVDQEDQLVTRDDLADDLMEIKKACHVFFQACIDAYNNEKQCTFDTFKKEISDATVQLRALAKKPNTGQEKINLIKGLGKQFTEKFNNVNTKYSQAEEMTLCQADYDFFQNLVADTIRREKDNIKAVGERQQVEIHYQIDRYIRERKSLYQLEFVDKSIREEFAAIVVGLTSFKDNYRVITKEDILKQAKNFNNNIGWNLSGLFDSLLNALEPKVVVEKTAFDRSAGKVYMDLRIMRQHALELRSDKKNSLNTMHGLIALDVCDEIIRETDLLFSDPNNLANEKYVRDYKKKVKDILSSKEEIMNQHSAKWKVYVGNLLVSLASVGIGAIWLLGRKIHSMSDEKFDAKKDSILFFGKTHRARDADRLWKDVEKIRAVKVEG